VTLLVEATEFATDGATYADFNPPPESPPNPPSPPPNPPPSVDCETIASDLRAKAIAATDLWKQITSDDVNEAGAYTRPLHKST